MATKKKTAPKKAATKKVAAKKSVAKKSPAKKSAKTAAKKSNKVPMSPALETKYNIWLKKLGRKLADIRKNRKLTQAKMAEKTGFDMKYYQDLEYGRRPITTRTLFQLCDGINISIQDLINEAEKVDLDDK
jgi:DNA-binding Xre family transcriptional regulator